MNWHDVFEKGIDMLTVWAGRIIGVLVVLALAWIVAGWVKRSIWRSFEKRKLDPALGKFSASLARYAILAGTVIGCLGVFGIQTASFAAVLAAAGLAIGLAFQGTLSNFASGVMILIFRPFKIGDAVDVASNLGIVKEIDLFSTEFVTFDNRRLIIPNSKIFGEVIMNYTHYGTRRVDVSVGTAYEADVGATRKVLESAAAKVPKVLPDPPSQIFLAELGDSSVNWTVRLWSKTDDYWDVYQDAIRVIKSELEGAQISIPFPQRDVHLFQANNIN